MINRHIGSFCIILYDQWMILQTVNWSDLLCIVFGFGVRTSQKCISDLLFVCLPFFLNCFVLERNTYSCGLSTENQPETHAFSGWVRLTLGGEY